MLTVFVSKGGRAKNNALFLLLDTFSKRSKACLIRLGRKMKTRWENAYTSFVKWPSPHACALLNHPSRYLATMDSGFGLVSPHQHGIPDTCRGERKQKQFLFALILAKFFEQFPLRPSLKEFHVMLLSRDIPLRHFEKFQLQH